MPRRKRAAPPPAIDPLGVHDVTDLALEAGLLLPVSLSDALHKRLGALARECECLYCFTSIDSLREARIRLLLAALREALTREAEGRVEIGVLVPDTWHGADGTMIALQARAGPDPTRPAAYLVELLDELHEVDPFALQGVTGGGAR